jgi:hypothetical protein
MRTHAPLLLSLVTVWPGLALADDPPEVKSLKAAGVNVGDYKGGGKSIDVKSAACLTGEVWTLIERLPDLKRFAAGGEQFDDAALERLVKLKTLETIFLNGPTITDEKLRLLNQLPHLRSFGVHHSTRLKGTGVAALELAQELVAIEFGGCTVNDDGVRALCKLKQLKELRVGHLRNTRATFSDILALPNLELLVITSNWDPVSYYAPDLKTLAACPKLRELEIHDMLLPWENGLEHLQAYKNLEVVKLYWCDVASADVEKLKAAMPKLKVDVNHAPQPETVERARKRTEEYETKGRKP